MALDFPSSPTIGQQYNGYVWDGTAWDSTSAQPISLSTPAPGYNYLINGGIEIAQRGASTTGNFATKTYVPDRFWTTTGSGAANLTVSQVASSLTGISKAMRVQRTSGNTATASAYSGQDVETVNSLPLAGKTVTFSFYARAGANFSAASSTLYAYVRSGTGTDQTLASGPYTGNVDIGVPAFVLTTSWQRFTFTGSVPANSTQVGFMFDFRPVGTAGANDYYEVTGIQLEEGGAATNFKRNAPSIAGELAACQRYYQVGAAGFGGYQTINAAIDCLVMFPVVMRATPSDTWSFTNTSNMRAGSNRWITAYGVQRAALLNATGSGVAWDDFKMSAEL